MNTYKWIIFILASIILAILDAVIKYDKSSLYNIYHGLKNGILLIAILKYII
jgi:hypothetical protein